MVAFSPGTYVLTAAHRAASGAWGFQQSSETWEPRLDYKKGDTFFSQTAYGNNLFLADSFVPRGEPDEIR